MKHKLIKSLTIASLGCSAFSLSAESFPTYGISMLDHARNGSAPVMTVTPDGTKYKKASTKPLNIKMKSKGRCQNLHYVGTTKVAVQKKVNGGTWDDTTLGEIVIFKKKKLNQKTWSNSWVNQTIPIGATSFIRNKAVKACNDELGKKLISGKSRDDIISAGFTTTMNVIHSRAVMHCHGLSASAGLPRNVTVTQPITVKCESLQKPLPKPKPILVDVKKDLELKNVKLSMNKSNYKGFCPATLKAKALVTTNSVGANFSYRFFVDGKPIDSWKIAKAKKGNSKLTIHQNIKVEKPKPANQQGNGNGLSNAGYAVAGNSGTQVNPQLQVAPTHKLSVKVRTSKKTISDVHEYSVTCKNPTLQKVKPIRPPTNNKKPDLTSRKGITIGSTSASWGQSINLKKSDAISSNARGCKYRFKYDVLNIGDVDSGKTSHKLKNKNLTLHTANNFDVKKGKSRNVSGHLLLKPGKHKLTALIDNPNKINEKKEDNNQFNITVNVDRNCGSCSGNNGCSKPGPQ